MNYSKHIQEKNIIKITLINDDSLHGFVINENDEFILIINENDFIVDGYKIIRKNIIKKIRYGKFKKFYKHLYEINKIKIPTTKLKIDFVKLLKKFKEEQEFIVVETYTNKKSSFDLGPITNIGKNYLTLKPISATGKFKKIKKIFSGNIDILSRGDRYSKAYQKSIITKK